MSSIEFSLFPATPGITAVARERLRQKLEEGFTAAHDDKHNPMQQLVVAAACYAAAAYRKTWSKELAVIYRGGELVADVPRDSTELYGFEAWPWSEESDKREKHDRKRCLEIAGALIMAELDRIDRQERGENRPEHE